MHAVDRDGQLAAATISSTITREPGQRVSARSTNARMKPVALRWLAILTFAFPWCPKSPDACERLAARLMPNPDTTFIDRCRADSARDRRRLNDKQIKTCAGSDRFPLIFQF